MEHSPTAEEIMVSLLRWAKEYGANINPPNGIVKFILPKADKDNPAGRDVMVEVNILNQTCKMTDIKH